MSEAEEIKLDTNAGVEPNSEQLMAASVIDIGRMAPFFFASLCVIQREEDANCGGIVVSPDKIYFNPEFVSTLTRAEISFYLIHGVYHILMMHHLRGKGRDPERWNLACDVFINSCIHASFNRVKPGDEATPVTGPGGETAFIKIPADEPFIDDISVDTDTPELIYYWFDEDTESETGKKLKKLRASGSGRLDLIEDEKSKNETDTVKQRTALRLKKKVETIYDQIRPTDAARGTQNAEVDTDGEADDDLIDWRTVLKSKLIALEKDEKSLSYPDKRFAYKGVYIEGPIIEEDALTDVKVCIDTSGSMTDDEIIAALYQVRGILRQYRTEAELVFWDETIESRMPFDSLHELKRAQKKASGRGGTNPNCIFEFYSNKAAHRYGGEKPRVILIFTDGYFETPDRKYASEFGNETIWVIVSDSNAKWKREAPTFGNVTYMKKPRDYSKMIRERLRYGNRNTEYANGHTPGDYITD